MKPSLKDARANNYQMNFLNKAKDVATKLSEGAAVIVDTNREKIVTDFELAVARQRVEFIIELKAITSRIIRTTIIAAAIIGSGLTILAASLFLHH